MINCFFFQTDCGIARICVLLHGFLVTFYKGNKLTESSDVNIGLATFATERSRRLTEPSRLRPSTTPRLIVPRTRTRRVLCHRTHCVEQSAGRYDVIFANSLIFVEKHLKTYRYHYTYLMKLPAK